MSAKSKLVLLFGIVVLMYVILSSNEESVEVEVETESGE
jgi:hypothetical protein